MSSDEEESIEEDYDQKQLDELLESKVNKHYQNISHTSYDIIEKQYPTYFNNQDLNQRDSHINMSKKLTIPIHLKNQPDYNTREKTQSQLKSIQGMQMNIAQNKSMAIGVLKLKKLVNKMASRKLMAFLMRHVLTDKEKEQLKLSKIDLIKSLISINMYKIMQKNAKFNKYVKNGLNIELLLNDKYDQKQFCLPSLE